MRTTSPVLVWQERVALFPHGESSVPFTLPDSLSALSLAPSSSLRFVSSSSSSTSEPRAALAIVSVGYSSPATVHNSCCACATNPASSTSSSSRFSVLLLLLFHLLRTDTVFSRSSSSLARGARLPPSPSRPRRSFSLTQLVLRVRHVNCASYTSFLRAPDSPSLSATSIASSVSPLNATSNLPSSV